VHNTRHFQLNGFGRQSLFAAKLLMPQNIQKAQTVLMRHPAASGLPFFMRVGNKPFI
jgi:hypothetical protein